MRFTERFWIIAAAFLFLAGCGNNSNPDTAQNSGTEKSNQPKKVIGLSVLTLTNPFFKAIGDSMAAAAAKEGYEVMVVSGDFDVARQQNQVKDFIVRKVAAIVLTPCDSVAIGPAIQEANTAGIPIFTADIASLAEGARIVTHVATDNLGGGRQAGQAMIEALGAQGGKVAIIHHKIVESCILRVKGFREGFYGSPEGKAAVKAGKLYASPTQSPEQIGAETFAAILKHFAGEKVPAETLIPTTLYRRAEGANDASVN
jgi:ribose transport system substrate-binding protein